MLVQLAEVHADIRAPVEAVNQTPPATAECQEQYAHRELEVFAILQRRHLQAIFWTIFENTVTNMRKQQP